MVTGEEPDSMGFVDPDGRRTSRALRRHGVRVAG